MGRNLEKLKAQFGALGNYLEINPDALEEERADQPFLNFHVGTLVGKYIEQQAKAELEGRIFEAEESLRYRRDGIEGISKPTEDAIKAAIRADPRWRAIEEKRIEALKKYTTTLSLAESMRMKERAIRAKEIAKGIDVGGEGSGRSPRPTTGRTARL